jgi:uncharacterized coiled-coil protein SlyX
MQQDGFESLRAVIRAEGEKTRQHLDAMMERMKDDRNVALELAQLIDMLKRHTLD